MKLERYRQPRFIIATAAVLYALALAVSWWRGTVHAEKRIVAMLESAERSYAEVVYGEIDAVLRNASGAVINYFDRRCEPQTVETMQNIAHTFNVDEVNLIDRNGITIASNVPAVLGFDFATDPRTAEFLALTNALKTWVSQPFRRGVANPEVYCKYYGVAFPKRDGIVQIGVSIDRLRENLYSFTDEESRIIHRNWHFSVVGWYSRADEKDYEYGRIFRVWSEEEGEWLIGRYFNFEKYRFVAYLPEGYCYLQRNADFALIAVVLAVLVGFFTFFLVRLVTASAKLETMHELADARTAADLALARQIQMSALPEIDGAFLDRFEFSFTAATRPAREVGGDFYDFYPAPDGRIVFLIADVSGKGIPAAMFMMEAKNIIKSCLSSFSDLAEAVADANRRICAINRAELFVTGWIGALDPKTGVFEYVNAGHSRPFVRRADGQVEKVMGKGGRFLGMFDDVTYRSNTLELGRGDTLYLYTDGITEAMNRAGELFGEKRLQTALAEGVDRVSPAVTSFVGVAVQSDDLTELAIRFDGEPERSERTFPCAEASLRQAVEFVRAALAGVEAKTVAAVLNAADEITSNIVSYSGAETFAIEVERTADRLRLTFTDGGEAYNPLSHVDPDTHASIEERPIGGLGLVIVKRIADRVTYAREDDRNVLSFVRSVRRR